MSSGRMATFFIWRFPTRQLNNLTILVTSLLSPEDTMPLVGSNSPQAVGTRGANAGTVLRGTGRNNRGLRLRVLQVQDRGHDGPIAGGFLILDVGDNKHADALRPVLGRPTDAQEVLGVIRRQSSGCVSVVNANILTPE